MLSTRLFGGFIAAVVSGFISAQAAQIAVNQGPDNFGKLNQNDTTACQDENGQQIDGSQACGPAAAVNSFQFLENRYPHIYGGRLIPQTTSDMNQNWIMTANALGAPAYMDCSCEGGTNISNFISGKQTWIEEHASGQTVYKHQDVFALGDLGNSQSNGNPSFDFLLRELMHGEDVELLVSYHDDQDYKDDTSGTTGGNDDTGVDADNDQEFYGGHFLTMTGLTLNDANNNGQFDAGEALTLDFIDPGTGAAGSANGFLNGFGFDTNYGAGGIIAGASISAIVSESPIPEPETIVLLVVCLVGFAGFKARRSA